MYISGHFAMGYLVAAGPALARRQPLDVSHVLIPALIGAAIPDIIDKPLRALDLVTYSRALGHSFFFFAALVLFWLWLRERKQKMGRLVGWGLAGMITHLIADVVNDAFRGLEARGFLFTAWLGWPITDARDMQVIFDLGRHIRIHPNFTSLEIGVFAMTLAIAIAHRQLVGAPNYLKR